MKMLFKVLLFITLLTQLCFAQWILTNGPLGGEAKCFTAFDTSLYVGTEIGVFRSTNNGLSWSGIGPEGIIVNSLAIRSVNQSGIYLFAGTLFGVYLSTDGGTNWNKVSFGLSNLVINCLALSDTNLFAGTENGVFLSPTNGNYWMPVSDDLTNKSIRSLTVNQKDIYAGTDKGLFVSTDNGTSWASTGLKGEAVNAFAVIDTFFFAGTDTNGIFRSTDNGLNWEKISNIDMDRNITTLAVYGTELYAGTSNGLYRTPTNGDYWIPINTGLNNKYIYELYSNGTDLFACTYAGVYRSTNNGANWSEVNEGLKTTVITCLTTSGEILYAGSRSCIYRSNDYGENWIPIGWGWVNAIAVSGTKIYGGHIGHLLCSPDSGVNWDFVSLEEVSNPRNGNWIFSLAVKDSYVYAGGTYGGVFRIRHNGPGSYTIFSTGQPDTIVYSLAVSDTNLLAGTANGVYFSSDDGVNWIPINNGLTNLDVKALAVKDTNIFAGTGGGGVFLSTNNGNSWTPVNNGLSGLALDVLSFAFNRDNLFVGTWRGGVYLSTNNGTSWTSVNTGMMSADYGAVSTVHSLAVVGSNLYAGTRGAGVWQRPLSEMITATDEIPGSLPPKYSLWQNYPNPFNPATKITYSLPRLSKVEIRIYDILGKKVRTLVNEEKPAGTYEINWQAANLPSGVYFYQLIAGTYVQTKKMILLK